MNRCTKLAIFLILFFLLFIAFFILALPFLIGINSIGLGLLGLTALINTNVEIVRGFINLRMSIIVNAWNLFVPLFNAVSTLLPTLFTIWNVICRAILALINLIVTTYCPTGLIDCLAGGISTALTDFVNIIIEIFGIFDALLDAIRSVLEYVICDQYIASFLAFTRPAECSARPLPITEVLKWLAHLFEFVFLGGGLAVILRNFACDAAGECALKATPAGLVPHQFPVAVPAVTNIFEVISRLVQRKAILSNILIGFSFNIFVLPADAALCALLPANFIPCVFIAVCSVIFTVVNLFDLFGTIPIFVNLATLICDALTGDCPCFKCANILKIMGPCVIAGTSTILSCAPCEKSDTILNLLGSGITANIDSSLLFAFDGTTSTPFGIQNQRLV